MEGGREKKPEAPLLNVDESSVLLPLSSTLVGLLPTYYMNVSKVAAEKVLLLIVSDGDENDIMILP